MNIPRYRHYHLFNMIHISHVFICMYYDELHEHLHKGEQYNFFPHLISLAGTFYQGLHALDTSAVVIHTSSQIVFLLHPYSDGEVTS